MRSAAPFAFALVTSVTISAIAQEPTSPSPEPYVAPTPPAYTGPSLDSPPIVFLGGSFTTLIGIGVTSTNEPSGRDTKGGLAVGLRPELLFGPKSDSPARVAFGPFLEVATQADWDVVLGGGGSLYIGPHVGLSAGVHARDAEDGNGFRPGVTESLFLGTHLYVDTSTVLVPFGLRVDAREGIGEGDARSVVASFDFDPLLTLGLAAAAGAGMRE